MSDGEDDNYALALHPSTQAAQALGAMDSAHDGLIPSLHLATTYERAADNSYPKGKIYSRDDNPSYDPPERLLASLEGGADALLFASGMAAASAVLQTLLPGDHIVAPDVMYYGVKSWLDDIAAPKGVRIDYVTAGDIDAIEAAMRPGTTKLVWVETPANPLWTITDIKAAADIAHAAGAKLVVDSTVATPVLTRPIEHGADIVMHSATKYLNGHSDVLAGALVTKDVDALWATIRTIRHHQGAVLGPFNAWLLTRGMRTLYLRVDQACRSAATLARHLDAHPRLAKVLYPGLEAHEGHAIAARQMSGGFGGMLSIQLGTEDAAIAVAARLRTIKRATSLGGIETLIEHRASVEGPASSTPTDLLRLSVGIEHVDDLLLDLDRALEAS